MWRVDFLELRTSEEALATFDLVLSDSARAFLESLSESDRRDCYRELDVLSSEPHPDGVSKVLLDYFPYQRGTFGAECGEFWISYQFLNAATLGIASVYWAPGSPRRAGELFEI